MTYGTSFQHNAGDKTRLAAEEYSRQCNASPEDGGYNNNNNNNNNIATVQLQATTDQKKNHYNTHKSSSKLKCPASISKLRVEKIEGGLMVAGVVVAANCQLALPAFGFLFMLVGAVLTAASYRGPGVDEDLNSYAARIAFTGNSRVLGPICIVVGGLMLALGALLCSLSRRARKRERRVGFHCPLHGDFYPLSPSHGVKLLAGDKNKSGWSKKIPCLRSCGGKWGKTQQSPVAPPQCPHSVLSSTRSSVSSSPLSPCPTPMPFLVSSNSMSGIMHIGAATATAVTIPPDPQNFGSIKSLSVTREIASFPLSRTPTPPTQHRLVSSSTSTEELPIVSILPDSPARFQPEAVVISVPPQPQPPRKSVSIVLPEDQLQNHMG